MSSQDRLKNEPQRAYNAFVLYRSLPALGRTLTASYRLYLDESGRRTSANVGTPKPSPMYQKWVKDFRWEERAAEWDSQAAQRLQDSLLEADRDLYLSRVDNLRSEVEAASIELMKISKTSIAVNRNRLISIYHSLPTEGVFVPMGKDALDEYSSIVRSTLDAARILTIASDKLAEALGLARLVEGLTANNSQN
jgi:hypothetical protein